MQQTVDVDANQTLVVTPVSGSSFCFFAAVAAAMDGAETMDAAMTAVCGSIFCGGCGNGFGGGCGGGCGNSGCGC